MLMYIPIYNHGNNTLMYADAYINQVRSHAYKLADFADDNKG